MKINIKQQYYKYLSMRILEGNTTLLTSSKYYVEISDLINGITETTSIKHTIDILNLASNKINEFKKITINNSNNSEYEILKLISISYEINGLVNELSTQYKNTLFKR